jgi:hypothetical protein
MLESKYFPSQYLPMSGRKVAKRKQPFGPPGVKRFLILREDILLRICLLINIIEYGITTFIKYFMNLQLAATCFGFLEP